MQGDDSPPAGARGVPAKPSSLLLVAAGDMRMYLNRYKKIDYNGIVCEY